MAGGVCVGACEQASAPGTFSGHTLAHRELRNSHPAYFSAMGNQRLVSSLTKVTLFVGEKSTLNLQCCVYYHKNYMQYNIIYSHICVYIF